MDGAFVVSPDGTVDAAARYIDAPAAGLTLSKGLGTRHWAAAAITRATKALAVVVSESNGTVRIFSEWASHPSRRAATPTDEMARIRIRAASRHRLRRFG